MHDDFLDWYKNNIVHKSEPIEAPFCNFTLNTVESPSFREGMMSIS